MKISTQNFACIAEACSHFRDKGYQRLHRFDNSRGALMMSEKGGVVDILHVGLLDVVATEYVMENQNG